jgi:hypothetical protein
VNRSTAFVSGWMQIRGARRRRAIDRGFVLSDHADWPGLVSAIRATGAARVLATHGATGPMVRWLAEQGYNAASISTRFEGEQDEREEVEEDVGAEEEPLKPPPRLVDDSSNSESIVMPSTGEAGGFQVRQRELFDEGEL